MGNVKIYILAAVFPVNIPMVTLMTCWAVHLVNVNTVLREQHWTTDCRAAHEVHEVAPRYASRLAAPHKQCDREPLHAVRRAACQDELSCEGVVECRILDTLGSRALLHCSEFIGCSILECAAAGYAEEFPREIHGNAVGCVPCETLIQSSCNGCRIQSTALRPALEVHLHPALEVLLNIQRSSQGSEPAHMQPQGCPYLKHRGVPQALR